MATPTAAPGGAAPGALRGWITRHRLLVLLVAGGAVLLLSTFVGSVSRPPTEVLAIISHQLTGGNYPANPCPTPSVSSGRCVADIEIVWDVRIPALLLALVAGAALGLSGATLQGVFRNPLADPYLLGLSSGATVGSAALFILGIAQAEANIALPVFAFLGSVLTAAVILAAAQSPRATVETLLLTGVALGSLLSAVLSVLLLFNPLGNLQVTFWLLGGLGGADWTRDGIALGGVLIGSALLIPYGREVNLLQLGPDVAQSLGVDPRRVRTRALLLASLVTAVAVAFTGVIGFVGLVSPHVVRRLFGPDYRIVLPGAALVGAGFLLVAFDLSELLIPSTELPVGIFTSFAGAPFFLYLLYRHRRTTGAGEMR